MSTATLSKKERKALRKQMMERKEQLLAKHGRSGKAAAKADSRLGSSRMFSDIKPKLPADPPKPKLPSWTPPAQPKPHRTLTGADKPRGSRRSLRPRVRDTVNSTASRQRFNGLPGLPGVRDLDDNGPGPLTRAAAMLTRAVSGLELGVVKAVRLWQERPWRDTGDASRAEAYRSLTLLIKPLRLLGIVAVGGAVVLGRESRGVGVSDTGSLVVLGMGLAIAVILLALAEIASGIRTVARRM